MEPHPPPPQNNIWASVWGPPNVRGMLYKSHGKFSKLLEPLFNRLQDLIKAQLHPKKSSIIIKSNSKIKYSI